MGKAPSLVIFWVLHSHFEMSAKWAKLPNVPWCMWELILFMLNSVPLEITPFIWFLTKETFFFFFFFFIMTAENEQPTLVGTHLQRYYQFAFSFRVVIHVHSSWNSVYWLELNIRHEEPGQICCQCMVGHCEEQPLQVFPFPPPIQSWFQPHQILNWSDGNRLGGQWKWNRRERCQISLRAF